MLTRRTFMKLAASTTVVLLPVSPAFASLCDNLEDLQIELEDARDAVADSAGPLQEPSKSTVAALLASALADITAAAGSWSLNGFTGDVETSYDDDTLTAVASNCITLARYARGEEVNGRTGWEQRCMNHLATIKDLVNRSATGYKARSGIA